MRSIFALATVLLAGVVVHASGAAFEAPPVRTDSIRWFSKTLSPSGAMTMSEAEAAPEFSRPGLVVHASRDAIVERFDGYGTTRKILYSSSHPDFPLNLVRLLSAVVRHGGTDSKATYETAVGALGKRYLSMTCGEVSGFAQTLLAAAGAKSRVASTLTLDKWNTYDNGHTLLEIWLPHRKRWMLVDIDTKTWFAKPDGDGASLLDAFRLGVEKLTLQKLSDVPVLDPSGFVAYQAPIEHMALNLKDWYKRVFQAFALVDRRPVFIAEDQTSAERIKSYSRSYSTLPEAAFAERFYGEAPRL